MNFPFFVLMCILADRFGVTDPDNAWFAVSIVVRALRFVGV